MPIYVINTNGFSGATIHFVETTLRYTKEAFVKMCNSFMEEAGEKALERAKSKKYPSVYVPDVISALVDILHERDIAKPINLINATYFSDEVLDPDKEAADTDSVMTHMSAGLLERIHENNEKVQKKLLEEYDAEE